MMAARGDLGAAASRGALYTASGQFARVLIQYGSLVILTRLLAPEDFGLYAMVLAIVGIGDVLRDFGLSTAAIQAREVSHQQRSNLFWLNAGLGVLLATIVFCCAPLITAIYDDPRIEPIAQVMSLTFLINGLASQHRADLNRRLRFGALSFYDGLAHVIGVGVAITIAIYGGEYWALVAMVVIQSFVSLLFVLMLARWVPLWYRRGAKMRGFLVFGVTLSVSQLLTYASNNAGSVALGMTLGPVAVGYYNRAFQTVTLPLSQLQAPATRVALPILSQLHDEPERYDRYLIRGQLILFHAVASMLALGAALATPLFALTFGDQWDSAVIIFQIFAIGGMASAANYAYYWVFLSKGLTRSQLNFSLVSRPLLLVSIVVGSVLGGPIGAAIAFSVTNLVLFPFTSWWLGRITKLPFRQLAWNSLRALVIYLFGGTCTWLIITFVVPNRFGLWGELAIGIVVFVAAIGCVAVVFPAYRRDIGAIISTAKLLRSARN